MVYLGKETRFTWLGHSAFLIETPSGQRVLIDPWLEGNPKCPTQFKDPGKVDSILVTHGHGDHLGDTVALALRHGCQVVCNFEIGEWLASKGVRNVIAMNKGGTVEVGSLLVTMTNAFHSSSIADGGQLIYGGEPAGYVCETENEFRFYHAGDTCVFGDMKLIGELHQPHLAMLPIGDRFTMGPREAAKAAHLLNVKLVVPMHYGTFDLIPGTPAALRKALGALPIEVAALEPGQVLE
ncbi:MAG: metal-dependent hydrolase [Planctomycetota bacterium]